MIYQIKYLKIFLTETKNTFSFKIQFSDFRVQRMKLGLITFSYKCTTFTLISNNVTDSIMQFLLKFLQLFIKALISRSFIFHWAPRLMLFYKYNIECLFKYHVSFFFFFFIKIANIKAFNYSFLILVGEIYRTICNLKNEYFSTL